MLNELVATPTAKSRSNCDETPDLPRRKKIFTAVEPLSNGIKNLVYDNPRREKKQDGKEKRTMVLSELKTNLFDAPSGAAPPPASCLTQTTEKKVEDRQLVSRNPFHSPPNYLLNHVPNVLACVLICAAGEDSFGCLSSRAHFC